MGDTKKKYIESKGGRKTSSARVRLYEGKGASSINGVPAEEYFATKREQDSLMEPIIVSGLADKVYFSAVVKGGGKTGQLDAVKLGIARAIIKKDEDKKPELRKNGLVTRDPRKKERKKYFLLKARKRPQFSKR